MNTDLLREWLELDARKRNVKTELECIQARLDQIEEAVLAEFEREGMEKITLDGRTMSISSARWPKAKQGSAALADALRAQGLGQYVGVNHQALRGWVTEAVKERLAELSDAQRVSFDVNDAIPEGLREHLEISEVHSVRATPPKS